MTDDIRQESREYFDLLLSIAIQLLDKMDVDEKLSETVKNNLIECKSIFADQNFKKVRPNIAVDKTQRNAMLVIREKINIKNNQKIRYYEIIPPDPPSVFENCPTCEGQRRVGTAKK